MKTFKTFMKENTEIVDINDLSSGFLKTNKSIRSVDAVLNGAFLHINKKFYKVNKKVKGNALTAGMIVLSIYNSSNQGATLDEILGFTDDTSAYGDKPKQLFKSVKDLLKFYNLRSLKALEQLQGQNEYGFSSYIKVKSLEDGDSGAWYYLFNGRWSRGSGAEPLSFYTMKRAKGLSK